MADQPSDARVLQIVIDYVQLINRRFKVDKDTTWDDLTVDGEGKLDYFDGIKAALEHIGAKFVFNFRRFGLRQTENMKDVRDFFVGGFA